MIAAAFRLGFHAAEPHANPTIEAIKRCATSEEPSSKVSSGTPNDSVEFLHRATSRLCLRQVSSRTLSLNFFTDLGRMRRERLERTNPKNE